MPKSAKTKLKGLHIFAKRMRLFWWDYVERMEQFEHGSLVHRRKVLKRMRTIFLEIDRNISSGISLERQRPDTQSASTTSCADLI